METSKHSSLKREVSVMEVSERGTLLYTHVIAVNTRSAFVDVGAAI